MAAVLNILSPTHRHRRRGPELSLYIPDGPPPSYTAEALPETAPPGSCTAKNPIRLRNRLRKRLPGLRTTERRASGPVCGRQPNPSLCDVQPFSSTAPRGPLGEFRAHDELEVGGRNSNNCEAMVSTNHRGSVSARGAQRESPEFLENWRLSFTTAINPSFWTTVSQDDLAYPDRPVTFGYPNLSHSASDEKGQSLLMDCKTQYLAANGDNHDIHPAFREPAVISNRVQVPAPETNIDAPPDFDSALDSSSPMELSRSRPGNRSASTSSSLYSGVAFSSPATSVSELTSPCPAETESVDVAALIQSAERLAAEYRSLVISRRATPDRAVMSASATSGSSIAGDLGHEQRMVRKMKSFHSLRRIIKGAEREIKRERSRIHHGISTIGEERFSFEVGDDAEYMPTSRFSDAATLVAIIDGDSEGEEQGALKEDQCEKWTEDELLAEVSLSPEEEEKLEIPPRHPGRLTRVWTTQTLSAKPTEAKPDTEPDGPRCHSYCSRLRSTVEEAVLSSENLQQPAKRRLDELDLQAFCNGCQRNVVWMADATEIRTLRSKDGGGSDEELAEPQEGTV